MGNQQELMNELKKVQNEHQTQMKVNKTLAAKVIALEKKMADDLKRR